MRLDKFERKRLNYIKRWLIKKNDCSTQIIVVCPFPDRSCEKTCGKMFPKLLDLRDAQKKIFCPCHAMIDGHISVSEALRKVKEVLSKGEI